MDEQIVKKNLVIMIETKNEINELTSQIKEIEAKLVPEEKSLTIEEINEKMESIEKNKILYADLQKQLNDKSIIRKNAEKLLLAEIPIFSQKINVDLGKPYGLIQIAKIRDLYGEQAPKLEYFHVIR